MAFAIAPTPNSAFNVADKVSQGTTTLPDPIYINQGGDTIATATVIPGIPYSDSGTTLSYASDYESCVGCFTCPYSNTGARDVVYSFTPTADICINIDLCSSGYDTKVYIGDGGVSPVVACDDDGCGSSYRSIIENANLLAGHTYYIFVDGWSSADAGTYLMNINFCPPPCTVPCPPGSTAEGEPVCYDNYYDSYNGGCNSVPPVFTNINCLDYAEGTDIVICGTYGVYFYNGLTYRDTDWYQITLAAPKAITWCVEGEYDTLVGIINGSAGCPATAFYDYNYGGGCTPLCVTDNLPAGTWWLWVGTLGWDLSWTCGGDYVGTLSGYACGPVAVEPTSWGKVKNLYK
jgi:hypothetical protein